MSKKLTKLPEYQQSLFEEHQPQKAKRQRIATECVRVSTTHGRVKLGILISQNASIFKRASATFIKTPWDFNIVISNKEGGAKVSFNKNSTSSGEIYSDLLCKTIRDYCYDDDVINVSGQDAFDIAASSRFNDDKSELWISIERRQS